VFVPLYYVLLDTYDTRESKNSVVIVLDFVVGNKELLAVYQENAISSTLLHNVAVEIVPNVVWSLDQNITIQAARNCVLLNKSCGPA
jgi:hypothetical protein